MAKKGFLKRLKRLLGIKECLHVNTRCVHGDEIIGTHRWKQPYIAGVCCLDCKKYLYDRELPRICSETGQFHLSRRYK